MTEINSRLDEPTDEQQPVSPQYGMSFLDLRELVKIPELITLLRQSIESGVSSFRDAATIHSGLAAGRQYPRHLSFLKSGRASTLITHQALQEFLNTCPCLQKAIPAAQSRTLSNQAES
jgi:hypothetical protein